MPKIQGRKPPKRKQPIKRSEVPEDIVELASVLAERALSPDPANLFAIPWRDGWNAVALALNCYTWFSLNNQGIVSNVRKWYINSENTPAVYEEAGEYITRVSKLMLLDDQPDVRMLLCALRCVQLTISNSSGGGAVYNDVLLYHFDRWGRSIDQVAEIIREARCHDAIKTETSLQNDVNDRLRRAFITAWSRGLYHAAYALPQAKDL